MERLTDKKEADAQRKAYKKRLDYGCPRNIPEERFLRLAAYEDTGLEPEEITRLCDMDKRAKMADLLRLEEYQALGPIDHLRELVEAEREGQYVVLPCKIGDAAYVLECEYEDGGDDCIFEGNVVAINIGRGGTTVTIGHMEHKCWFSETEQRVSDLNTDWFLTRAEAEAAQGGGGERE